MIHNFEKFARGIAAIAKAFGIKSDRGKVLLTAEGFLTLLVVSLIGIFSLEYMFGTVVSAIFKSQAPHPYQWDAFLVGFGAVILSLILVWVRELLWRSEPS